ncbi:4'-phosphopantetheinyl transferase superfamily protein [Shewanella profunda]|nr:4'-phosphopantetheinyl transferase superfamily protein [Shewanella profunda]
MATLDPKDWCFEYGPKGKPSLTAKQKQQTGLEFNLSHSGDWLLIGVVKHQDISPCLLGVDIERSRPKTDIYPILNHYFSDQETEALLALADESAQRQRFFDLWALKESYIKATGLGLAQSLKSFAFELTDLNLDNLSSDSGSLESTNLHNTNLEAQANTNPIGFIELKRFGVQQGAALEIRPTLPVYRDIRLHQLNTADPYCWQIYFGRLNLEYRFALSLASAGANNPHAGYSALSTTLSMQMLSVETLLN